MVHLQFCGPTVARKKKRVVIKSSSDWLIDATVAEWRQQHPQQRARFWPPFPACLARIDGEDLPTCQCLVNGKHVYLSHTGPCAFGIAVCLMFLSLNASFANSPGKYSCLKRGELSVSSQLFDTLLELQRALLRHYF